MKLEIFSLLSLPWKICKIIHIIYWYYSNSYQTIAVVRIRGSVHGRRSQARRRGKKWRAGWYASQMTNNPRRSRCGGWWYCDYLLTEYSKYVGVGHCNWCWLSPINTTTSISISHLITVVDRRLSIGGRSAAVVLSERGFGDILYCVQHTTIRQIWTLIQAYRTYLLTTNMHRSDRIFSR